MQGQFNAQDAVDIITQLINVKIKFHENKIESSDGEEATKMREKRIKDLQRDLHSAREHILANGKSISIESIVHFS
jgi:hypothetical protein